MGILDIFSSDKEKEVEKERVTVPYDEWPTDCYACDKSIDTEVRSQFAIHKGEGEHNYKAVGLCKTCTRTYSTLLDHHDVLVKIYDESTEPVEL